jgi:hypothetical protein
MSTISIEAEAIKGGEAVSRESTPDLVWYMMGYVNAYSKAREHITKLQALCDKYAAFCNELQEMNKAVIALHLHGDNAPLRAIAAERRTSDV